MKQRTSFVANSSSSSFIIIGDGKNLVNKDVLVDKTFIISGSYEFGWEETKYTSCNERIAFAYLQAMIVDNQVWLNMLDKVIKEHTGAINVENKLSLDYKDGNYSYIDHQSSSIEGENIEIFESEDILRNFLFDNSSYIQGDNDNH